MQTCFETTIAGHEIKLEQDSRGKFWVTYGQQEEGHDYYDCAAKALGAAIMHAAACAGKLINKAEQLTRKD